MTTPVSNINRTNLNALDPNLATGQVADPALRKACFDEIYNYFDTFVAAYNAFIANGGIATGNLADFAVTTAKLALGAVTAAQMANAAIGTGQLADLNVTTAKLADANVTTGKLADLAVTTAKLADANITTGKIVDGAVTAAKLDPSILVAGIPLATHMAANPIDHPDGSVTTAKLALLSVGTPQIADNGVTYNKMDSDNQADLIGGEIYAYKNLGGY